MRLKWTTTGLSLFCPFFPKLSKSRLTDLHPISTITALLTLPGKSLNRDCPACRFWATANAASLLIHLDLSAANHRTLFPPLGNLVSQALLSPSSHPTSTANLEVMCLKLGVLEGSVLGPLLFPLYTICLCSIIHSHETQVAAQMSDWHLTVDVWPDG